MILSSDVAVAKTYRDFVFKQCEFLISALPYLLNPYLCPIFIWNSSRSAISAIPIFFTDSTELKTK